ncbi:MAG: FG-GAP repeat domain-containing protein, partial [Planctomycetia bacterium]
SNVMGFDLQDLDDDGDADLVLTGYGSIYVLLQSSGSFVQTNSYTISNLYAGAATIADLNDDGDWDLVVGGMPDLVRNGSNGISVFLGQGNGSFGTPTTIASNVGIGPLRLADVNSDHRLDVVHLDEYGAIIVRLGRGDGTFHGAVVNETIDNTASTIYLANLDFDQLPELLSSNGTVVKNRNGTFPDLTAKNALENYQPTPTTIDAVGDFTRDGIADIVRVLPSADPAVKRLQFIPGNTRGTFRGVHEIKGFTPRSVTTGDFNDDGLLDYAVFGSTSTRAVVSVYIADTAGRFGGRRDYVLPTGVSLAGAYLVGVGDRNGDGRLDLAVSSNSEAKVWYLDNVGFGRFAAAVSVTTPVEVRQIVLADKDNDGDDDLLQPPTATAGYYSSLAAADLNADGHLDMVSSNGNTAFVHLNDGLGNFVSQGAISGYVGARVVLA